MVVGIIIGASIFVQPSEIAGLVPSVPGVFGVWIVAGLLTLFGALCCAELASAFPRTGGVYVFLKETYSPAVGFLWGWAMFWSMHSGIIAAIAVVFARYVGYFVPLGDRGIRLVAIGAILVLSGINYLGVKQGSLLQTIFTLGKVIAIVAILVLVVVLGSPATVEPGAKQAAAVEGISVAKFVLAVAAGLFAFGGWHMVTYTAEETRRPERTIFLALIIGTLTVTACYMALNTAYFYALPLEKVALFDPGGGGRRRSSDWTARRRDDFGGRDLLDVRRGERRHSGWTSGVFRDGARWIVIPMVRRGTSALPDAAPGHRVAGDLGFGTRRHGHLPRALHPRYLYRVDLLWPDGARTFPAAPANQLCAGVPHLGIPGHSRRFHSGLVLHCGEYDCLRTTRQHNWTGNRGAWSAGVLFVGAEVGTRLRTSSRCKGTGTYSDRMRTKTPRVYFRRTLGADPPDRTFRPLAQIQSQFHNAIGMKKPILRDKQRVGVCRICKRPRQLRDLEAEVNHRVNDYLEAVNGDEEGILAA